MSTHSSWLGEFFSRVEARTNLDHGGPDANDLITSRMSDVLVGPNGIGPSAAVDSSLPFEGSIHHWEKFQSGVSSFYKSPVYTDALHRFRTNGPRWPWPDARRYPPDYRPVWRKNEGVKEKPGGGEINTEGDLYSPFLGEALDVLCKAIEGLWGRSGYPGFTMWPYLDYKHTDNDEVTFTEHPSHVLIRVPHSSNKPYGTGLDIRRNICVGLVLAHNEWEMRIEDGNLKFKCDTPTEALIGLVYQAMVRFGVRYAFITTYMQTVFFAAHHATFESDSVILFSDIVNHSDAAVESSEHKGMLETVSFRLSMLYVIAREKMQYDNAWDQAGFK